MAAVAVFETLSEEYSIEPDIKWSNDVLVGGKKISGILAEGVDSNSGFAVVLGIGINLTSKNFPKEIRDTATSIKAETGLKVDSDSLAQTLTRFLIYFYNIFSEEGGDAEIRKLWSQRSSYAEGKRVVATIGTKKIEGITRGIEKNGALRLKVDSGETIIVHAGEIETIRESL